MNRSISLAHEFTYRTSVLGPHTVGNGPLGQRHYYEMIDGFIDGRRLSGRTIGAGADWMLVGSDGFLRMDVRIQVMTDDGAVMCVHYRGLAEANAKLTEAIVAGEPTNFGDQRIRTIWTLEAGDLRYAWANQGLFVGEGRCAPTSSGLAGFEHRVYRVG